MSDGEVIERLIVQFEADLSKLEKSMARAAATTLKGTKDMEGHFNALEKFMGEFDPGKALEKTFSRARLGLIEEGGARIGVFGSALEALGPIGLAAGAGLAAFAVSGEQAMKAMEWAEQLEVVAKKLGVTTTAIQEMDFVAAGSGVSSEIMRDGLQKVSQAIGLYQSNVKDARVKSIFEALGISKDDARSWQTPVEGLEAIADKIHALKSTTEQLALAQKLRVPPEMVPLLQMGGDKIREMRGEAERAGAVMDHSMVAKAAELAAKMKETNQVITVELHAAFVALAPVVLKIATLMAAMARFAADTAQSIAAIRLDGSMDFNKFSERHLLSAATDSQREMSKIKGEIDARDRAHPGANSWDKEGFARNQGVDGDRYNMLKRMNVGIAAAYKAKIEDDNQYNADAGGGRAVALVDEKGARTRAAPDRTEERKSAAEIAFDEATKAAAEAQKALAVNIAARAQKEIEVINAEAAVTQKRLEKEREKLLGDGSIEGPQSDLIQHKIEQAQAATEQARLDKVTLVNRQTEDALSKQALEYSNQQLKGQIDALTLQADLATKGTARRDIELKILALQEQVEAATLEQLIAAKGTTDAERALAQLKLEQLNLSKPGQIAKVNAAHKDQTPGEAYIESLRQGQANGGQTIEVNALKSLNKGLTDAIMNSKSLGDVFKNVLKQIEAELLQLAIDKYLTMPLAKAIGLGQSGGSGGGFWGGIQGAASAMAAFGFAGGTDSAPGGTALVGEMGPELVNLPRGSQVIPNNTLKGLAGMNPSGAGGVNNISLTVHVDAKDAVLTDQVRGWVAAGVSQAVAMAVPVAVGSARRVIANDMAQRSRQAVR